MMRCSARFTTVYEFGLSLGGARNTITMKEVYSRHHLQLFESPTRRGVSGFARCLPELIHRRRLHSTVRNQGVRGILHASKLGGAISARD
jgi:hypothetical protein